MKPHDAHEIASVVILDIAVIVILARLLGLAFRRIRQPAAVAEIIAGLALGPSVVGALPGDPSTFLFPDVVRPYLAVVSGIGLVIFMFIVGLELDLGLLRGQGRIATAISGCSVVLPFGLGVVLALWLHGDHSGAEGHEVTLLPFALFIGAAMSVTAFPVLARIMTERGMHRTKTGALALASAAIDDVLAWVMLAVVLAVVQASDPAGLLVMVVESAAFVVFMFLVIRPRLHALVAWRTTAGRLTPDLFAVVLVGVLICSFITDRIGIHSIFGAFVFGAVMPRRGAEQLSAEILERVEQITVLMLLPVFFITTGLNVDIGALGDRGFVELAAVVAVACVGKFVGATVAARWFGIPTRRAAAVGVLMNTRGLTELVILNIGLETHVLDRELFTVLVLMAIITTVMAEPLLRHIYTDRMIARDVAQAERAAFGLSADHRVVAAVGSDDGESVVDLGVLSLGRGQTSELVVSRFDPPFATVEVGSGLTSELAAVAANFEATQALAQRAADLGAEVVVRSRFTDDVVGDLLAQLAAADADLVVISGQDAALIDGLVAEAECGVAVLVDTRGGDGVAGFAGVSGALTVAVVPADSDGLAVVELGCRLASRNAGVLHLVDRGDRRVRRRADALRKRIASAELPFAVESADAATGHRDAIVVLGWSEWRSMSDSERASFEGYGWVVAVRAAVDDQGDRFTRFLEQAGRAGPAPSQPDVQV